ncbi:MAG: CBS domain-containing protein [Thermodesulfobacteriota bacterium]
MPTAREIMTPQPITVSPDLPIERLAAVLWEKRISGAPVVDADGQLLGVVTESDLVDRAKKVHLPTVVTLLDAFLVLERPSKLESEWRKLTASTVADIMTRHPVTVDGETSLEEVATIMAERRLHTLPVTKAGRLVGVIGKADIIRTLARPAGS